MQDFQTGDAEMTHVHARHSIFMSLKQADNSYIGLKIFRINSIKTLFNIKCEFYIV